MHYVVTLKFLIIGQIEELVGRTNTDSKLTEMESKFSTVNLNSWKSLAFGFVTSLFTLES